jgi:DNA-directed RNA polymerase specialized sigma subunit
MQNKSHHRHHPVKLAPAESEHLLAEMVAGVPLARDRLIEGNMYIVDAQVQGVINLVPDCARWREDMTGEGDLTLVTVVNTLKTRNLKVKVNTYLTNAIRIGIGNFIDENDLIRVPKSSQYDAWKRGEPIEKRQVESYDSMESDGVPTRVRYEPETEDPMKVVELRNLIHSCAESPKQLQMLELLEQEYTIREVAKELGIPKSTISHWRKEIEHRYNEKIAELEDDPMPARVAKKSATANRDYSLAT